MQKVTVYEKPTCRKTNKLLTEKGIDFEKVNYYIKPFSKNKLKTLLKKMDMKPSELLRKNEQAFKELDVRNNNYTETQMLDLMVENHDLVQRPIVEKGNKGYTCPTP